MKVLVTGGAGFIGSHIVDALLRKGHGVVVLDNFFTGKQENLAHVKDKIKIVEGDIRELNLLKLLCKDTDAILHQAALRSVPVSLKDARPYNEVNATGTYNVLEAARINNVKRVVLASSSSVYGTEKTLPLREELAGNAVRTSPYAITKFTGEDYARFFANVYGLSAVSLRYFNVFGPRQDPKSEYATVIPRFILGVASNQSPTIFGHGNQRLDFTYVDNIVHANILGLEAKHLAGEAVNVGNGKNTSVNELFEKVCQVVGKKVTPLRAPFRFPGEDRNTLADLSFAKTVLGFEREVDFEEGLKRTVAFFICRKSSARTPWTLVRG